MRYSSKGRPFDGEIPPLYDPRWRTWTKPLLAYLNRPRTWKALKRWGSEHKIDGHFLRHQLAWLEDKKLAASKPPKGRKGAWIWFGARSGRKSAKPKKYAPVVKNLAQKALRRSDPSLKRVKVKV